ncbi:MAG: hypothetical protein HY738_09745 [Bacteroidia bacterium]|nr:hypothetical protein [Bacteroidia bacterium]
MNTKTDFLQFEQDKIFAEIIRRICKDVLTDDDVKYIENYDKFWDGVRRYEQGIRNEARNEARNEKGIEIAKGMKIEKIPYDIISKITGLSKQEIDKL